MATTDDYNVTVATDTFDPNGYQVATVIWVIITFLIVVTIVFEYIKDVAIESSDKYTRPITITLFAEMTLLGWLSICAFTVNYTGYLDIWSLELFGSDAPTYIYHKMTDVQYFIFLILILLIIQVFILVAIGNSYTAKFDKFNEVSQDKEEMLKLIKEVDELEHTTTCTWLYDYFCNPMAAWDKHDHRLEVEETVLFYALRKEHCLRRSPIPPYQPEHKSRQLPANFDYGHYLSLCLSKFLKSVTSLTWATWVVTLLFFFLIYGILVGCNGNYLIFGGVWIGIGYVDMFLLMILEARTHYIFEHLMNPAHLQAMEEELAHEKGKDKKHLDFTLDTYDDEPEEIDGVNAEAHSSFVKRMSKKNSEMPMYTSLEPTQPSLLSSTLTDPIPPNRHEQLFFGDKLGPELNIMFVRMHLIVQSVYLAFMSIFFLPLFFADFGWKYGLGFLVLVLLPFPIQFLGFYGRLIVEMSHSQNTGCLKAKDTEVDTIKDQRAEQVVKLMLLLSKLAAKHKALKKSATGETTADRLARVENPYLKKEIEKISALYDRWDLNSKKPDMAGMVNPVGLIGGKKAVSQGVPERDIQSLLLAFGINARGKELETIVHAIDTDHDGFIHKDDLIEWRIDSYGKKAHINPDEEEGGAEKAGEEEESGLQHEVKEVFEMLKSVSEEYIREQGREKFSKIKEKMHAAETEEKAELTGKQKIKQQAKQRKKEKREGEDELTDVDMRAALYRFLEPPYNLKLGENQAEIDKAIETYVADFFEDYDPEEGAKIDVEEMVDIVKEAEEQEEGEGEEE